jgi:hypothetical protein
VLRQRCPHLVEAQRGRRDVLEGVLRVAEARADDDLRSIGLIRSYDMQVVLNSYDMQV